jgi:hypothetical protein
MGDPLMVEVADRLAQQVRELDGPCLGYSGPFVCLDERCLGLLIRFHKQTLQFEDLILQRLDLLMLVHDSCTELDR